MKACKHVEEDQLFVRVTLYCYITYMHMQSLIGLYYMFGHHSKKIIENNVFLRGIFKSIFGKTKKR